MCEIEISGIEFFAQLNEKYPIHCVILLRGVYIPLKLSADGERIMEALKEGNRNKIRCMEFLSHARF